MEKGSDVIGRIMTFSFMGKGDRRAWYLWLPHRQGQRASLLAFAPIFCANVVFSHAFRDSLAADIAFASNLLGAMFGGMLEYIALALGYKGLLLFVIVFYVISYLTRGLKRPAAIPA